MEESRYMYDQLAVLSPVMLALTAATPVFKGRLVDTDVRWNTIALAVDDRTPAERGLLDHDVVRMFFFPRDTLCSSYLFSAKGKRKGVCIYVERTSYPEGHVPRAGEEGRAATVTTNALV